MKAFMGVLLLAGASSLAAQNVIEDAIRSGLEAWRRPDASGAACANCHGPDGIELARFQFSDADFVRRDLPHVSTEDSVKIIRMIKALRAKYSFNGKLLDPLRDRPLQPGGQPIAGVTPAERDWNTTLLTFQPKLPTLFVPRLGTLNEALRARDELLAFDTRRERVGIVFPRLSEDIARGSQHGSLNDWIPEIPHRPKDAAAAQQFYALQDAYLANPSEENFWRMYHAVDVLTDDGLDTNTSRFTTAKYRSLLQLGHLYREEALGRGASGLFARTPAAFRHQTMVNNRLRWVVPNPIFAVGSHSHQNLPVESEFHPMILAGLDPNVRFRDQLRRMMLPWWYMAWTLNTGLPDVANRHEYFPQSVQGHLGGEINALHYAYVTAKMDMTNAYVPVPQDNGAPPRPFSLPIFNNADDGFQFFEERAARGAFHHAQHQAAHRVFALNTQRMRLLLTLDYFNRECAANRRTNGLQYGFIEGARNRGLLPYARAVDPANFAADEALFQQVVQRAQESVNFCQPLPRPGNGTGLTVEYFDPGFTGTPVRRVEPLVAYGDVHGPRLAHPQGKPRFSARWSGQIEALFTENYTFELSGINIAGSARLWINGQLVLDAPGGRGRATVALSAGQRATIRLEHEATGSSIAWHLSWQSNRQMRQVIPAAQSYPL